MADNDILQYFQDEAMELFEELNDLVEDIEDQEEYPIAMLEDFAQKIDRIMGSAETLHMNDPELAFVDSIAIICKLCKKIGYNARNFENPKLLPIYAAFWGDCLEVLEELTKSIEEPHKLKDQTASFIRTLQGRLEWLLQKLQENGQIRSGPEEAVSQDDIDALISSLAG
ncbi:MAG: hypothetical protein ACPGJV_03555 [Bacteriovoracaceae bacterium]